MQDPRLQYARIIITGASSGFGEAFARRLAPHTGELLLIARSREALLHLAKELAEQHTGLRTEAIPCDLTDDSALDQLITSLTTRPPAKTLLINNAGAGDYGEFAEGAWNRVRLLLKLNMESLTHLSHALIPGLQQQGGDIINISSLAALLPIPDFAVYAATKAYVSSFSEALRLELKTCGIRVLAVCPGPVSTGFGKAARRSGFTGNMMPGRNAFDTPVHTVVEDTLKALHNNRARVFPGMKIKLVAFLLQLTPTGIIRLIMGRRPRKVQPSTSTDKNTQS